MNSVVKYLKRCVILIFLFKIVNKLNSYIYLETYICSLHFYENNKYIYFAAFEAFCLK